MILRRARRTGESRGGSYQPVTLCGCRGVRGVPWRAGIQARISSWNQGRTWSLAVFVARCLLGAVFFLLTRPVPRQVGSLNQHPTRLPLRSPPSSESETGRDAVILMLVGSELNTLRPPGKKMASGRQQRGETAFPNPWLFARLAPRQIWREEKLGLAGAPAAAWARPQP